jgi:peptidoglycan/LPS O-acetylase OafA/YrhL
MKITVLDNFLNKIKTYKRTLILSLVPVFGVGFLRLLLALAVVFAHAGQIPFLGFMGSEMAVRCFFIISGFYMALILTEKYQKYYPFISNRFLKIFPLYFIILILTISLSIIGHFFLNKDVQLGFYFANWNNKNLFFVLLILILSNIFLFGQDIVSFIGVNMRTGSLFLTTNYNATIGSLGLIIPQAWTLSLEMMFYLLAPFIVRQKNKVILFLTILSGLFVIYYGLGTSGAWTFRFFPAQFVFFMFGIISYRIYKNLININVNKYFLTLAQVIIFLYVIFYSYVPLGHLLQKGLFFLLLIIGLPLLFILSKKSKFDRYVGDLAYPIFLSHFFVTEILALTIKMPKEFIGATVAIISILISILLYNLIIKPIDSFRRQRVQAVMRNHLETNKVR